jgi:hypothetical protein
MNDRFRDEYFSDVMKKGSLFESDQLGGRKTSIFPILRTRRVKWLSWLARSLSSRLVKVKKASVI